MDIYITDMKPEHIEQAAEIEKQSFSVPWTHGAFEESLFYEHTVFLVAVDKETEKVAGYVGMYRMFDEGEVTNIAVLPEYRGQGIGYALMSEIKNRAEEKDLHNIILEVRQSNERAIRLYEKTGFERIGIRKNFYEKPLEDAIVMCLKLLPL